MASREECSSENEQNVVTVDGDGTTVVFKQIAGLIARRIVFTKKPGDRVATGERIGLIKFGSRMDVLFGPEWEITVRPGQRVAAGSSIIARRRDRKIPMALKERLRRSAIPRTAGPRKAAYALPTLFTAGNIFLGYISILRSFQGAMLAASGAAGAAEHFAIAAQAIGAAVFLDGLDGRIARMTNTTSDFGREMDSLADVISFGIAPAVLAFAWGVQFIDPTVGETMRDQIFNAGYFIAFLFLLCGACRLARFNIQKNPDPQESRPARPQVFRRTADSRRRRHGGRRGLRRRWRAAGTGGRSPSPGWCCCCCSAS